MAVVVGLAPSVLVECRLDMVVLAHSCPNRVSFRTALYHDLVSINYGFSSIVILLCSSAVHY